MKEKNVAFQFILRPNESVYNSNNSYSETSIYSFGQTDCLKKKVKKWFNKKYIVFSVTVCQAVSYLKVG